MACLFAIVAAGAGCGARPAPTDRPVPALASTPPAAEAFSALRRRWAAASRLERKDPALESYLLDLRERYASQEVVRQADLYLAWISLERGDYEAAITFYTQSLGLLRTAAKAPGK